MAILDHVICASSAACTLAVLPLHQLNTFCCSPSDTAVLHRGCSFRRSHQAVPTKQLQYHHSPAPAGTAAVSQSHAAAAFNLLCQLQLCRSHHEHWQPTHQLCLGAQSAVTALANRHCCSVQSHAAAIFGLLHPLQLCRCTHCTVTALTSSSALLQQSIATPLLFLICCIHSSSAFH